MNGKGESLMNKTKFITGSIGTKCLPSLLHISVFGMHKNFGFFSLRLPHFLTLFCLFILVSIRLMYEVKRSSIL